METQAAIRDARILIVDDEESVVRLLKRVLQLDGFTNIASTTDPRRAASLFEAVGPDLLMLDINMPNIDGFELIRMLGACRVHGVRVPTMVITADVTSDVRRRALVAGVDDFLTKPVVVIEVQMRVRYLVEARLRKLAERELVAV